MQPVVAIGIDAADPVLLERMMQAGQLRTLERFRAGGAFGSLQNLHYYRAETAWTMFLTGVKPERTSYWSPLKYSPDYDVDNIGAYDFSEFRPFYALGPRARVAAFDLPQTRVVPDVNGIQVVAWGAHSPLAPSVSEPLELLGEITSRYGQHPALESDEAPIYSRPALLDLRDRLVDGLARRAQVTADLLRREPWDLFVTMISETHSAGHYLWHLSQPSHPLYETAHRDGEDPLGDVWRAVDRTIGAILDAVRPGSTVLIFSGHGMEANSMDLPSMVFLPELLFRHSFPGRRGVQGSQQDAPLDPPASRLTRQCWEDELYALKDHGGAIWNWLRRRVPGDLFYRIERKLGMNSAPVCFRECSKLHYQPAWWYRKDWPVMKAFALPSFSEGYVRINLTGRDAHGIVQPADYEAVCEDITTLVGGLRDARSGKPLVRNVLRTRRFAGEQSPGLPDPDLIVSWEPLPTDVVDTTALGRIGPVPFLRSGSHVERGFVMLQGPGVGAGTSLRPGHSLDLPPTILTLMGLPVPSWFDGTPLTVAAGAAA
jgi:predicted AlkP superfamily phosphohydrolase/phosphomutase